MEWSTWTAPAPMRPPCTSCGRTGSSDDASGAAQCARLCPGPAAAVGPRARRIRTLALGTAQAPARRYRQRKGRTVADNRNTLAERLSAALGGDPDRVVRTDRAVRAAYASDASLYRSVPEAVVEPRGAEDVARTLEVAGELGVPVTARGGGTSVAGNAIGPGAVVDFSARMNRVVEIRPDARTAVVQPGAVLDDLRAEIGRAHV